MPYIQIIHVRLQVSLVASQLACGQQVVGWLQREAAHGAGVAAQPVVLEAAAVRAQLLQLGAVVHLPPLRASAARHLLPPLCVVPLPQPVRRTGDRLSMQESPCLWREGAQAGRIAGGMDVRPHLSDNESSPCCRQRLQTELATAKSRGPSAWKIRLITRPGRSWTVG